MMKQREKPETVKGISRHMSFDEALELTGWSRYTLYRKVKARRFPPRDPDTGGFRLDWLRQWQEGKREWTREADSLNGRGEPLPPRHQSTGGRRRPA
jgi:predicted DNA-binding transcriptional regulator AlpA